MTRKGHTVIIALALMLIMAGSMLSACSSTPSVTPSSGTSSNQSSNGTAAQTTGTNTQSNSAQQGGGPGGGGYDMVKQVIAKAASTLGVTEEKLTSAYEEASTSVFGSAPSGQQRGNHPLGAPIDASGGTPPSGGNTTGAPFDASGQQPPQRPSDGNTKMTMLYARIGEILGISTETVTSAFEEAMTLVSK